jgi:hypothetical protein
MSYAPSFSRVRSRKSPLGVVVLVATSLALLGGFLFDTARLGPSAPQAPAELRT